MHTCTTLQEQGFWDEGGFPSLLFLSLNEIKMLIQEGFKTLR
jgi:hypothetical protein